MPNWHWNLKTQLKTMLTLSAAGFWPRNFLVNVSLPTHTPAASASASARE
jgi:hypothetical protein